MRRRAVIDRIAFQITDDSGLLAAWFAAHPHHQPDSAGNVDVLEAHP